MIEMRSDFDSNPTSKQELRQKGRTLPSYDTLLDGDQQEGREKQRRRATKDEGKKLGVVCRRMFCFKYKFIVWRMRVYFTIPVQIVEEPSGSCTGKEWLNLRR